MKFTMTKIAAAAALAFASTGALADPLAITGGNFTMYDPTGAINGNFNDITGFVDLTAMTWSVASVSPFFGLPWTASGGTLYGVGTHTVNINGDGALGAGAGDVTFTVGAGQIGGNINFAWGATTGIDVFNVWNIDQAGPQSWVSTNINALPNSVFYNGVAVATDTWAGLGMFDGPFPGFSANFNVTPVPEASTYGMMLAGLGLVAFAVRRRKMMAA